MSLESILILNITIVALKDWAGRGSLSPGTQTEPPDAGVSSPGETRRALLVSQTQKKTKIYTYKDTGTQKHRHHKNNRNTLQINRKDKKQKTQKQQNINKST